MAIHYEHSFSIPHRRRIHGCIGHGPISQGTRKTRLACPGSIALSARPPRTSRYHGRRAPSSVRSSPARQPLDCGENPVDGRYLTAPPTRHRKSTHTSIPSFPAHDTTPPPPSDHDSSILHWIVHNSWPTGSHHWGESGSRWRESYPMGGVNPPIARRPPPRSKSASASVGGSSAAPSNSQTRILKSKPYAATNYELILRQSRSYLDESPLGITKQSSDLCENLKTAEQHPPSNSLFDDDIFKTTCRRLRRRNKVRIFRDIMPLLVPSAETLSIHGNTALDVLIETVNESWTNSVPCAGPRPQPDYCVGFCYDALTEAQHAKLSPYIGDFVNSAQSYFMATCEMCFPFLTCEVKSGQAALEIADRQNGHSMTLAVRGLVSLYTLLNQQMELDRTILAFSVSHDHHTVKLYGHYPVIVEDEEPRYYRHVIYDEVFAAPAGAEKWRAYRFVMNIYQVWMPTHWQRIRSAIDALPDSPPSLPLPVPSSTEGSVSHLSSVSPAQSQLVTEASLPLAHRSAPALMDTRHLTPSTSTSGGPGPSKRPRLE